MPHSARPRTVAHSPRAQPKAPPSVQKSWNAASESFEFGAADGTVWHERDVVRIVWSSLKGTYEYVAADGTKWDDRNLEATQTGSRDLADPSAWLPRLEASTQRKAMPKYVLAMLKEERERARTDGGKRSAAFEKASGGLKRKLAGSLRRMLKLFEKMDEDGSGSVDKAEFRRAVAALGWDQRDIVSKLTTTWTAGDVVDSVFEEYDRDRSGQIEYHEYIRHVLRTCLQRQCGRVMDLFRQWDEDRSGTVDKDEFIRAVSAIGVDAPQSELEAMFSEVDADGSGSVSFGELNALLRQGASVQLDKELEDGAVAFRRTAANKYATRKDKNARTGPLRKATLGELKKWLASRAQRVTDMFRSFDKNGDVTQRAYRTPSAMRACAAMRNALLALPRCCHLVESLRPRA